MEITCHDGVYFIYIQPEIEKYKKNLHRREIHFSAIFIFDLKNFFLFLLTKVVKMF